MMNEWIKLAIVGTYNAVVNGIVTFILVRRLVKGIETLENKILKNGDKNEKNPPNTDFIVHR